MLCVTVYLLVLFCSTKVQSNYNQEQFEYIRENVTPIVNILNGTTEVRIYVNATEKYSIFTHLTPGRENIKVDEIEALNTAVSCKFGNWSTNTIFDFIKLNPLFYQRELQDHNIYKEMYKPLFDEALDNFITNINSYIGRCIHIISHYMNLNSNISHYDINILRILLTLNIKTGLISSRTNHGYSDNTLSDNDTIQMILVEMNALQNFLAMNCTDREPIHGNSKFYGFWIPNYTLSEAENNIKDVFYRIEHFKIEKGNTRINCTGNQMLLENIINAPSLEHITKDIKNASVYISETEIMSIQGVLKQIETQFDLKLILLYQESILTTIMKLICRSIIKVLFMISYAQEFINKIQLIAKINLNC